MPQSHEGSRHCGHPGNRVRPGDAGAIWARVGISHHRREPDGGFDDRSEGDPILTRSRGPVAGHGCVDDGRVELPQSLEVKSEERHDSRAVVFKDNVRALNQFGEDSPTSFVLEVQSDRPFVAGELVEAGAPVPRFVPRLVFRIEMRANREQSVYRL